LRLVTDATQPAGGYVGGIRDNFTARAGWPVASSKEPKGFGGRVMKIEYLHASKYGNGALVAAEFQKLMEARGVIVDIQHIRDSRPTDLPPADLYVFSSPGRLGKPIGRMRRFLKKATLPAGTRYAILTTEAAPKPDTKTGRLPTEAELARYQRVRPIMNEILQGKGLVRVAEGTIHVVGLKGPLEDGWEHKVEEFTAGLPVLRGSTSTLSGTSREEPRLTRFASAAKR
jgi:hypothetical protein